MLTEVRADLKRIADRLDPQVTNPQPLPGDRPEFMSAGDIANAAQMEGWDVDYRQLLKVRRMPDNGKKGKGRQLLYSAAMEWIKKHCPRLWPEHRTGDRAPLEQPTKRPLQAKHNSNQWLIL